MSSEPETFLAMMMVAASLTVGACADVRRGEYWVEPTDDGTTGGPGSADGPADGPADGTAPDVDTTTGASGDSGSTGTGDSGDDVLSFEADVLPLLRQGCQECHTPGGEADDTTFILDDDAPAAYAMTLDVVDLDRPASSRLLTKANGQGHLGGVVFDPSTTEYQTILLWIEQGALP